jgi:hypothetical protein
MLVNEGYAIDTAGERRSRLYASKQPYREATDPLLQDTETSASQCVPSASGTRSERVRVPQSPPQGGDAVAAGPPDAHEWGEWVPDAEDDEPGLTT